MGVTSVSDDAIALRQRLDELTEENARLRDTKMLLERLVEQAPFSIQVLDAAGKIVQINAAHERFVGLGREEYYARMTEDFRTYLARTNPVAAEALAEVFQGRSMELAPFYYRATTGPHGEEPLSDRLARGMYMQTRAFPVRGSSGDVAYVVVINEDVTERVRLEQQRAESERRYRLLVENLYDAVVVFDEDRTISMWNTAAERIYGWTAEEVLGRPSQEVLRTETEAGSPEDIMNRIITEGAWHGALFQWTREDRRIEVECTASYVPHIDGSRGRGVVVCVNRDVTEHKRMQAQLVHAQKMESIGTLAGGIAHEFNNMLAGILGYASLLSQRVHDEAVARPLKIIRESAKRGAKLTQQLLTFARKQESAREPVSINKAVESALGFLAQVIGKSVEVVTEIDQALPLVAGDQWQLEQVVVNLCLNARDSMQGSGRICIETRAVDLPTAGGPPELPVGRYVRLRLSDTGEGMKREVLDRIFEPFFTTKQTGAGTGLGLSVVYGIVRDHGGGILVTSALGKGTTFDVLLPALVAADAEEPPAGRLLEPQRGEARVLVVDDEPVVREMACEMLAMLGYETVAASGGAEAVEQIAASGGEIDLVLMDLIMPGMDGLQTFRAMRALEPELCVVVSSGLVRDQLVQRVLAEGAADFVGKPYDLMGLAATVARALGR